MKYYYISKRNAQSPKLTIPNTDEYVQPQELSSHAGKNAK
jgi:hypothetical protein